MDFFAAQEQARRRARQLVAAYLAAVMLVVASYAAAAWALGAAVLLFATGTAHVPWQFPAGAAALAAALVLATSLQRVCALREGGPAVAALLGARYVDPHHCTPAERRLVNVVEEMAIASGVAVPPVYVLERERAVNALVAGHSPHEAVLIVTRGALERLSRDELQGVIGHEFSHILNGDMALNLRLAGLLAGLTWLREQGERLVHQAAEQARGVSREKRGEGALAALFGALVAFVGFPGTVAASALKAGVSRQQEFLADAASVQFTRNPEGLAGALDSVLYLRTGTMLSATSAQAWAHMFFAPAVAHAWTFATHPPILERIRRAHPRFQREDYRAVRHGRHREVAVLDGAGNVVKHARDGEGRAAPRRPAPVELAAQLLAALPLALREALRAPGEAERVLFALGGFAERAGNLHAAVQPLARRQLLELAELALPALRAQPQQVRDRFLAEFDTLVEADGRVTLRELVLATFLRQHLREGAGQPIPARYRKVREIAQDACRVLSLLALAAGSGAAQAFARGAAVLGLEEAKPMDRSALEANAIRGSLERLRQLAPFQKPAVLRACKEVAAADGVVAPAEADLVRMVAATLDCPAPLLHPGTEPGL